MVSRTRSRQLDATLYTWMNMKRFIILLLTCLLALSLQAAKKPKADVGIKYLDANFKLYDSLQKQIFNFAETGYKEFRSAEQWASFLESQGFSVERGVAGIPTAFVATYGNGGPVIGMMAEYDAIEDVPTTIRAATADSQSAAIYNLKGQRIDRFQHGVNIVGGKRIIQ